MCTPHAAWTTAPGFRSWPCTLWPTSLSSSSACPPATAPGSWDLGARLAPLRDEGVLVVGSGHMTHGLPYVTREMLQGAVPAWSADFDAWAADALTRGDIDQLAAYRDSAPADNYIRPGHDSARALLGVRELRPPRETIACAAG
ncbi:DODA-type extradiol aromatic ring-opening family dioxygenase [Nonomuraea gerenzanensis]|uniref:DODA-type extradiol aromatic ring-opening family dioxygenase n=1 Tax=Nonomuraea gerenzanensis TaxID=93944 RepID=UPI00384DE51A